MERVPHHDGPETVLELLNRPEGFFAFRPAEDDEILLVSKVQTVSLSVDRQAPIADPARLSAARLLDYLNASQEAFFAVWSHAATHYVNRAYVLFARPLT